MIVDANVLLYATNEEAPPHSTARRWLTEALSGEQRIGIPWQSIGAFARISTHPRVFHRPLSPTEVKENIDAWFASDVVWIPPTTVHSVRIYNRLAERHHITGNLVPDAQLAALAIEHGVAVVSFDSDFARFPEVAWVNPLRA